MPAVKVSPATVIATTTKSTAHPALCVCKACSCGRHRCTGRDHSNVVSVGGGPRTKFEAETENHMQFHAHPVPPRPQPREQKYQPNDAVFDGTTTNKTDYQEWHQKPEKLIKKEPEYVPPTSAFDGTTTNKTDYKRYDNIRPPQHREAPKWKESADDRDFKSTNAADYVQHPKSAIHRPLKHEQLYVPNEASFKGESSYTATFSEKVIPPRFHHVKAKYTPSPEALSHDTTNREDYKGYTVQQVDRAISMKPDQRSKFEKEDRAFETESKASHGLKQLVVCPVIGSQSTRGSDGHLYMVEKSKAS